MLEAIIISVTFGYILGSCATIILIIFMQAARPDTPRKVREDLEGLRVWMKSKKKSRRKKK